MSDASFRDLDIPEPDTDLGIGSGTHAEQVGRTMIAFEQALATFEEERIGGAPVVGAGDELLGVLTISDLLRTGHVQGDRVVTQRGGYEMSEPAGEERGDELDPEGVEQGPDPHVVTLGLGTELRHLAQDRHPAAVARARHELEE